jgi:type III secretion protein R
MQTATAKPSAGAALVAACFALAIPADAAAQAGAPAPVGGSLSTPLGFALALSLVALLPFAFLTLTAFVKISTVLQIVRGAIGAQNIPSNAVILALSGALTVLAMAPVGSRIMQRAGPLFAQAGTDTRASVLATFEAAREPIRAFLKANSSDRERTRFYELARSARPDAQRDQVGRDDLPVVVPAFVVTELMEAFALGFAIFLPFLVVDLVVANVLLALGMQMMNPTHVSLPFKLLLFIAVDGWGLLAQALVSGYAPG